MTAPLIEHCSVGATGWFGLMAAPGRQESLINVP